MAYIDANCIININEWTSGNFLKKGTEIIKNGQLQNNITFTGYAYKYNGETSQGSTLTAPQTAYDSSTQSFWIKSLDRTNTHMGSLWSSEISITDGGFYIELYDSDAYIEIGIAEGSPRNNYRFKKRSVEFIVPSSNTANYSSIYFIDTRGMSGKYRFVFQAPRNSQGGVKIKNMYRIPRGQVMHNYVLNTYPTSYED